MADTTVIVGDGGHGTAGAGRSFLAVLDGPAAGRYVPLATMGLVVGRGDAGGIDLEDPGISGRHCLVVRDGTRLVVSDLGSRNGTFVNGARIATDTELPVGGVLGIGRTRLRHELLSPEEVARKEQLTDDLGRARDYLLALLPPPLRDGPVRIEWRYSPSAELSGDAFGYHRRPDGRLAFYLLDVSGHGVGPALHTVSAMNLLRKESLPRVDFGLPAEVLGALNDAFPMEEHSGLYFTLWYGVYDAATRRLDYASAGHPPALLVPPDGSGVRRLRVPNLPIGMMPDVTYHADAAEIAPGSRLYVFSDGAFEVRLPDGEYLDVDGFEEIAAVPPAPGESDAIRIEEGVRARMDAPVFEDDFSLLVLRFTE